MNGRRLRLGVLYALLAIGVVSCSNSGDRISGHFFEAANSALGNHGGTISFSSVTAFKWDQVFVFTPYTPKTYIDAQLGYDWPNSAKSRLESSKAGYLIVFVKAGSVVSYCEFSRHYGDFELFNSGPAFAFGSDAFRVTRDTNFNRLIYTPVNAGHG